MRRAVHGRARGFTEITQKTLLTQMTEMTYEKKFNFRNVLKLWLKPACLPKRDSSKKIVRFLPNPAFISKCKQWSK